jgi:flagellar motor switch protein FliG
MLTGEEKGALLLKNLAPEAVDAILTELGPDRGGRLRALMDRLRTTEQGHDSLDGVLQEVGKALLASANAVRPQANEAAAILQFPGAGLTPSVAPAPPRPAPPAASPAPPVQAPAVQAHAYSRVAHAVSATPPPSLEEAAKDPLGALARMSGERLALALEGENARTVSLLLNYLDGPLAGDVFKRLPAELRNDVTVQFTTQGTPKLEVLKRIALAVLDKSRRVTEKPQLPDETTRYRKIADMLRLLDKPERLAVMTLLQEKEPEAALEVKAYLYRFEDVLRVEGRSMQKVLANLDTKNLAIALKGAAEAIKDKFLASLSKRAQETLLEEMELAHSVQKDQIEQGRKEVVEVIQRLDLAGELVMT